MINRIAKSAALAVTSLWLASAAQAQPVNIYSSGSTGADGPFNPILTSSSSGPVLSGNTPAGTTLHPLSINGAAVAALDVPLNPAGVYNFTTITVPDGVRVRFIPNASNTPVVWLATGDVNITGEISVAATDTQAAASLPFSAPGPGGYAGASLPDSPGFGPNAGFPGSPHAMNSALHYGAFEVGPPLGLPLSGGSGGASNPSIPGGGGGGVIYIASSTSISFLQSQSATVKGLLLDGVALSSVYGYGAAGQAALFANVVSNPRNDTGHLLVCGVRVNGGADLVTYPPFLVGISNSPPPTAVIASVGGVAIPANPLPSAVFQAPQAGPNGITVQTANLPAGIIFTVFVANLAPNSGGNGYTVKSTLTTNLPPTFGTSQSASAQGTIILGSGLSYITAAASAPVLVALAPRYEGDPVNQMRVAIDKEGRSHTEFVTKGGSTLSYEAAMRLAAGQGKWEFLSLYGRGTPPALAPAKG